MKHLSALLLAVFVAALAQAQTPATDMKTLVGRRAVAQRMPFYQPGTYQQIPKTYAGQTATIIEVKPSTMFAMMPNLTASQMASLPPQSRENIENVRNASILVVQFADGTKADTGAMPVMPSNLPSYLEVIGDPVASSPAVVASVAATATTPSAVPGQAQTATETQPISEAFSKAAVRLAIGIKNSETNGRIQVLTEEAEVQQSTPIERTVLQDLALLQIDYVLDRQMSFATLSPYGGSNLSGHNEANAAFEKDIDCLFAYISNLKALSGVMPQQCVDAKKMREAILPAIQRDDNTLNLDVCLMLAKHNAKRIAKCNDGRYATKDGNRP